MFIDNMYLRIIFLCLSFSFALFAGCGDDKRMKVGGEVTVDGVPVEYGFINFKPINGTAGPTAGSNITEGKYDVPSAKGPFAGEFRVEIVAIKTVNKRSVDMVTGERLAQSSQRFLPKKYNEQSELTVEISADKSEYDFPLTLESKK